MKKFIISLSKLIFMISLASGTMHGAASAAQREYTFINNTDEAFNIRIRAESNQASGASRIARTQFITPLDQNKRVNQEVFKFEPHTAFKVTLHTPGTLRLTGWPATVIPALDTFPNGQPAEISRENKNASIFSIVPPYQSYKAPVYIITDNKAANSTPLLPSSYFLQFIQTVVPKKDGQIGWTHFDVELKDY